MGPVQPRALHQCNIKLTSIGILFPTIRHRELIRGIVFVYKILIREVPSVDGMSTSTVLVGYVSALDHKMRDDPVENVVFVVEFYAFLAGSFFTSDQASEVLRGFWAICIKFQLNSPNIGVFY